MSACACGKPNNHCDPCSTEPLTSEEKRLLREAWRQLQWFQFVRPMAEGKAPGEQVALHLNAAYVLKSAEIYRQIDAVLKIGDEVITEDL